MTNRGAEAAAPGERIETDESGQRYSRPVPVEVVDLRGVKCVVCLDEGCEWCPAVEAFDDDPQDDRAA